jgi:site-specific DNA recombinase
MSDDLTPALKILRTSTDKQETGLETQNNSLESGMIAMGYYSVKLPLEESDFTAKYLSRKTDSDISDWHGLEVGGVPAKSVEKMKSLNAFVDEGVTGGLDPFLRPGFASALKYAEESGIKTLIFYHNDRLSRETEDALRTIRILKAAGYNLVFMNVPALNFESPEDYMLFTNLAMLATYFKEDLKRKTKAGMKRLKDSGMWVGEAPYGFYCTTKLDNEKDYGSLMYNFQELEVLYIGMKHFINTMPHSYRGTASFLNSQGYTTRRGKDWTGQHIKNILTKSVVRFELSEAGHKRFAKLFTTVEDEEVMR